MKLKNIFLGYLLLILCLSATSQTIDNPFMITINTFDEKGLENNDTVYDNNGTKYVVVKTSIEIGLETNIDGEWKKHGRYFRLTSNKPSLETDYIAGRKNGLESAFYPNGEIKSQYWYADDQKNGDFSLYCQINGQVERKGSYLNNKLHGKHTRYYENGNKKEEKTYDNGKIVGTVNQYNNDGELMYSNSYD